MDFILQPWPWHVSGIGIAFVMFLLIMDGKSFGMSSNLRTICSIGGADKISDFFSFDWKAQRWNLIVLCGAIIGGYIASNFLSANTPMDLNENTLKSLNEMGFADVGKSIAPKAIFGLDAVLSLKGFALLLGGGFLVGFGARYAGGCTSGHAISGLSNLQIPSLLAVIGFFIGGIIMTHFLLPLIF